MVSGRLAPSRPVIVPGNERQIVLDTLVLWVSIDSGTYVHKLLYATD